MIRSFLTRFALVTAVAFVTLVQVATWVACGGPHATPTVEPPLSQPAPTTTTTWSDARTLSRAELDALVGRDVAAVDAALGAAFDAYVEVDEPHAEVRSYRVVVASGRRFLHVRFEGGAAVAPIDPR